MVGKMFTFRGNRMGILYAGVERLGQSEIIPE